MRDGYRDLVASYLLKGPTSAAAGTFPRERLGSSPATGHRLKTDRIVSADRYVLPCLVGFLGEGHKLIMNDHDGPGVVPGRYAGEAIRLHDGHHTAVHEGGLTTTGAPDRWLFSKTRWTAV
jgi:hypothetical protein